MPCRRVRPELVIGRYCDCGNRGGGRRIGDECRDVNLQPSKLQAGKLQTKRISIAARGRNFYLTL
jgi:hypothetical protein